MNASTKQRVFWAVLTLLIVIAIFLFSFPNELISKDNVGTIQEQNTVESDDRPLSNTDQREVLTALRKAAPLFLFFLLGFSLFYAFSGFKGRIAFAVAVGCICVVVREVFFRMTGQDSNWRNTLSQTAAVAVGTGFAFLLAALIRFMYEGFQKGTPWRSVYIKTVLDSLSLLSVLHYAGLRLVQNTMFSFVYSDQYKILALLFMSVIGGVRFLYIAGKKSWELSDDKQRSIFFLRQAFAICLAVPFVLVGLRPNCRFFIYLSVAALCLYDMDAAKVFRSFFVTIGILLASTVLCCLCGTVRNLVVPGEKLAGAFGTVNTTDFASYFSFLLLTLWCGMRNRKWYTSAGFLFLTAIASYVAYWFTESRTVLYSGMLTLFFVLWEFFGERVDAKNKRLHQMMKGLDWLCVFAFPLIGICAACLVAGYAQQASWALKLDELISGRLKYAWLSYEKYGVHPLGSAIETMYGFGRTSVYSGWSTGYSYLDMAYAMLLLNYGWIITAIVAGLWMWISAKALKCGEKRILFAMAILAAHAFSETRILDINYNIFLVMPFCAISARHQERAFEIKLTDDAKRFFAKLFVGAAIAGCVYLILPKAISWLRTFFSIHQWTSGTAAFYSLLFISIFLMLLVLLVKTGSMVCTHRSKTRIALLLCAAAMIAGSVWMVDRTIERTLPAQEPRIKAEEQVIRQVQAAATLPVYASEASELYQRRIGGFAEHIFSAEELGRKPAGTLFVDQDVEVFSIVYSGGQYTQISPWSGIYSYDPAVIELLTNEGYEWKPFYSGTRHCNLKDTARFNGLKPDDRLELVGPLQINTKNMETDQFRGTYEVTFTFSSLSSSKREAVVTLRVLAEMGARTIIQEVLKPGDFDLEGKCTRSIAYYTWHAPRVSFSVTVSEDVRLTLEDISWRRIV